MIHGILEIEDVPFLQRLLKYRLGTRALSIEGGGNSRHLHTVRDDRAGLKRC